MTLGKQLLPLCPFVVETGTHKEALKSVYNVGRVYSEDSEENAFDHYVWQDSEIGAADIIVSQAQSQKTLNDSELSSEWCSFYSKNSRAFFKDRNWILKEFYQLKPTHNNFKILDIGCGVGNTSIPLIEKLETDFSYHIHACDYSKIAIDHFPKSDLVTAFVHDAIVPFPINNVDVSTLFFVLSAIKAENWQTVLSNVFNSLKPGGVLLFRDYGYYDLTQLRFKPKQCIGDSLYQRSDGTLTYFAKIEWLSKLATEIGFDIQQLILDRRVIVNRKTRVKMKRVWIHGCFRKPE